MLKVFALLVGLVLIAGPSYALVGIDDTVPGHDIIVPFIVENATTGLDTLVMIQEISDAAVLGATEAKAAGALYWRIFTPTSVDVVSGTLLYSGGDVVPVSIRDLILTWYGAGPANTNLGYDLNGDGTIDSWVGYIYFENRAPAPVNNNLIAYFHYADLAAGRACGANAAVKEFVGTQVSIFGTNVVPNQPPLPPPFSPNNALGFNICQFLTASANNALEPNWEFASPFVAADGVQYRMLTRPAPWQNDVLESFSPAAYFWSAWRERGFADPVITANAALLNFIRFMPRFYLYDANGETYIIFWKSRNHRAVGENNNITVLVWDETEHHINRNIAVPNELNIIRVRDVLPPDWLATYPSAGWIDITIAGDNGVIPVVIGPEAGYLENWRYTEFLMWTWMFAGDAAASLNWASLWTDRQVGTLGAAPRPW